MTTAIARVLVGIDGSEQSLAAVRAAAAEAARRDVPLHIIHAFIWSSLHVNVGPVAPDLPGTGLRHQAEDLLTEAAAEAAKTAPQIRVSTHLIDGAATPVLLEESDPATLLVLGDRGLGGFSGLIIGSVAVHAAAHARSPILVVRGAEPATGPVVVGVDGSEHSRLAIGFAFEESAQRGAELIALHVSKDLVAQGAGQTLTKALSGWHQKYPAVVVKPELVSGDPRHELVERSKNAQLMVLGASGRDTFKGLLLGSVSQNLLYHPTARSRSSEPPCPAPPRAGSSDNVDRFLDRPVNAVSGLVPGRQQADEVLDALRADGANPADVVVLHNRKASAFSTRTGRNMGGTRNFVRFFQNWGYDDAVLNLYDEGLRKGETVVVIPSTPEDKVALARLLQLHQGHAIHYFGLRAAESLSGP